MAQTFLFLLFALDTPIQGIYAAHCCIRQVVVLRMYNVRPGVDVAQIRFCSWR